MMPLFAALFLFVFVMLFGALIVFVVSGLGSPKTKKDSVQLESYECGLPESYSPSSKVPIKFYLTAILFILFDIEIIFMYPWAITFKDFVNAGQGIYIMSVMGIFLFIFIFGLFWEIKSKALEWD